MPQLEQRPQAINGVVDWLKAKEFFTNRVWTLSGGEFTTIINGEKLTTKQFLSRYPIPDKIAFHMADENPDGTKQYYYKPKNKKL
jgi:hypothetical protein